MSNACRTFINSLQRSNRKFSKDLLRAKNERVLISQKDNIRCYVTIQKPIRNGSEVRLVNQFQKRSYCCNEQYVVKSPYGEVEIPNLKLHEYIWEKSEPWPDKVAIVNYEKARGEDARAMLETDGSDPLSWLTAMTELMSTQCAVTGRHYTYSQMKKLSETIAASFQNKFGLKKGDCIAVCLPNLPEYPLLFLAGSQAGLVITTLNPVYTPDEIAKQLKDANAKFIITLAEMHQNLDAASNLLQKKLPIVVLKSREDSPLPPGAISFNELMDKSTCGDFKHVEISNEDTFVLPYSSGTTGMPKGVELTHRNLVANTLQLDHPGPRLLRHTTKDEQDNVLAILPMFHIYGMVVVTYTALVAGAKLVTIPKFEPQLYIDTFSNYKINIAYLVPPLVLFLANHPGVKPEHLSSLRNILSGAAPLGFNDIERVHAKAKDVKIGQGFGMTETSPTLLSSHKDRYHKFASTGVPMPSTLAKITDVDTGDSLPPGKVGELRVKGPQVMKGYLNRPEANRDIFDHHGWLRTGDTAYYDEDGDFFIVDRIKELIKVKGFQVAPAELEEILRSHPKILDAGVIGVRNEEKGEVPKAFVVIKPGEKVSENEVKDFVKAKVTKYKHLEGGVVFLDAIPKSAAGKILRKELKANYGS